jgi:inner membrane transporter RhtA
VQTKAHTQPALERVPAAGLMLGAIASVQVGAAVATMLFDDLGPAGTVLVRVLFAAIVLAILWRPAPRAHNPRELRLAVLFGLALAAMNLSYYESIDRIPLGVAVTLEFVGPLGVAIAGSRDRLDLVWAGLAAAGVVLLGGVSSANLTGVLFALLAGCFWGAYILLSARVGRVFPGGSGLALAMCAGAIVLLPVGIASAGSSLLALGPLAAGFGVAMLSSLIPYSFELEALRRLPANVFGVLMSLEPAMAALAGFVVIGQGLAAIDLLAIALVVAASIGAMRGVRQPAAIDA